MIRRNLPRSFDELTGLRARGLVRESTVEQGDNSGPIVQRRDQEAFAARWGLRLEQRPGPHGEPEPYLYTDLVSGSDAAKRPQFQAMVVDARAGAFDVLLVRDTSRFARNWRQAGGYEDQLHAAGVVVAYIMEGRLSSDRAGQLQIVVNHAINEEYRLKLAENVQRGFRVKRFEAAKFSGTAPIGYVLEYADVQVGGAKGWERRDTGILLPDDEPRAFAGGRPGTYTNADLVRHLGRLYASGALGARPLAARLNAEGYRNRRGDPFTGNGIRHIIESPTYAGILSWHHRRDKRERGEAAEEVPGAWEALWPADVWEQIQAVRRRHWRGSAGGRMRNVYPLRRLATCDRCGSRLYGEARDGVTYMACVTQRERHACDQRGVRTTVLEEQIGTWLDGVRIPDDWREQADKLLARAGRAAVAPAGRDQARIIGEMERLKDLYIVGDVDRETYVHRKRALDVELTGSPLTQLAPVSVLQRAKHLLDELGELWREATAEERSEIAQTLFTSVRVRDQVIVEAEVARPEYQQLLAIAEANRRTSVGVAPPDGSDRTRPTIRVAGVDELVAHLLAA